jgi:hypothetical protein
VPFLCLDSIFWMRSQMKYALGFSEVERHSIWLWHACGHFWRTCIHTESLTHSQSNYDDCSYACAWLCAWRLKHCVYRKIGAHLWVLLSVFVICSAIKWLLSPWSCKFLPSQIQFVLFSVHARTTVHGDGLCIMQCIHTNTQTHTQLTPIARIHEDIPPALVFHLGVRNL